MKISGQLEASFRARGKLRGFSPAAAARHRSRTRPFFLAVFYCLYDVISHLFDFF